MNGICHAMPHAGHCGKGVCANPQMRLLTQVLEGVPLGRHGISFGIFHHAYRLNARGQQLDALAFTLRCNHLAFGNKRTASGQILYFSGIIL